MKVGRWRQQRALKGGDSEVERWLGKQQAPTDFLAERGGGGGVRDCAFFALKSKSNGLVISIKWPCHLAKQ